MVGKVGRRHHLPEVLTLLVCFIGFNLGLSLIIAPQRYEESESFRAAVSFASPEAWGGLILAASLIFVLTVFFDRKYAAIPAFVMVGLWSAWAVALIVGARSGSPPSSAIVYSGLSWVTLALAVVYLNDRGYQDAEPRE